MNHAVQSVGAFSVSKFHFSITLTSKKRLVPSNAIKLLFLCLFASFSWSYMYMWILCSHVWISLVAPLSDSSLCQPITLNPYSYPICQALKMYVSCQVVTLLSQHAFYTTCYPPNTHLELEETGFNIILILTEHARATSQAFERLSSSCLSSWVHYSRTLQQ